MTMLDDDRLRALLGEAGGAFEVPATGAADIVARAAAPTTGVDEGGDGTSEAGGDTDESGGDDTDDVGGTPPGRVRRLTVTARRHPLLSVAASVVAILVVAGTIGAVVRTSSPGPVPVLRSGLQHGAKAVPGPLTTTTIANGSARAPKSPAAAPSFGVQGTQAQGGAGVARSSTGAAGTGVTTPTSPPLPNGAVGQPAKIEQTGTLGISVRRGALGHTMTKLSALASAYGGFVANSQTQAGSGTGGTPYGSVTIQVPVDNFGAVLKGAQALGKTSSLTTKATDVTGQYVDLQARIAALQSSRQQYLTILSRASTIGDVLAVQSQLDSIQNQIEQLQGQLNLLSSQTTYSTLTVTVSEGAPPPRPAPLPESGLVRAWHDSAGGFLDAVEGTIRIAGPLLFALLCVAALGFGGRALWRRYQRHNL